MNVLKHFSIDNRSFCFGFITGGITNLMIFVLLSFFFTRYSADHSPIQYLEKPVSYENKKEASFRVIQVMDPNTALAHEGEYLTVGATTVVLLGSDFYSDQIVTVKNPQRIGTYSYVSGGGLPMTVPVVKGDVSTDRGEKETAQIEDTEPFRRLEQPESYEGKKRTSFQVYEVVQDGYALAREETERYDDDVSYHGNDVLLVGKNFYDRQVINIENPQKIGIFKYYDHTVPVVVSKN